MIINVIDYRGDETIINSRGDSLFLYRTNYFKRQQQDFAKWKAYGHKFVCFTQHNDDNYSEFDEVIHIPRSNPAQARNKVLDYYKDSNERWLAIWDNDATLYWDKLNSKDMPKELDIITNTADSQDIWAFVLFNAQQSPYPIKSLPDRWTFKQTIQLKGTMLYLRNTTQRFNETLTTLEDLEYAVNLTHNNKKVAMLQHASLKELVNGKSTIFQVNAYHQEYKNPGQNANPQGLLQWDAQLDRKDKYKLAIAEIEVIYGKLEDIRKKQKVLWKKTNAFNKLFESI